MVEENIESIIADIDDLNYMTPTITSISQKQIKAYDAKWQQFRIYITTDRQFPSDDTDLFRQISVNDWTRIIYLKIHDLVLKNELSKYVAFVDFILIVDDGTNTYITEDFIQDGANIYDGRDRKEEAWICAKNIVIDSLKAPKTAEFPSYADETITAYGDDKYTIESYVDAENSFGTILRTNFKVTLTLTKEGYKDAAVIFED